MSRFTVGCFRFGIGRETTWGLSRFSRSENGTVPFRNPEVILRPLLSALILLAVGFWLGGTPAFGAEETIADAEYQPGTPFTYLFDTGSPSPRPLSRHALTAKQDWALVPEDNTEHEFQGDVVLLNDKLAVVLRKRGPGAEVYSQTVDGAKFRAVVMSADSTAVSVTGISSLGIMENNPGAVMVRATFQTDGGTGRSAAGYRLTTGQAMLEMTGGQSADRFFVWCKPRYVVVPNYFADDMVFSPAACDLPRFGLPTESFLLNLIEGGDAILMCVWRDSQQAAHAILTGEGRERVIRGCEIQGGEERTLWTAFLEEPQIWHERVLSAEDARARVVLDWRRPFEAMWRADFLRFDGLAESWPVGSRDTSEGALAGHSDRDHPCWFDGDRLVVRPPPPVITAQPSQPCPGPILVYPIDRGRATPLTAFCPVDVLRNTLGVGPCQYVLETEGLASETNATPDHVMDWVEKQFEKKKDVESADQIKEHLNEMTDHVGRVQARIDEYAAFVRELQTLCRPEEQNEDGRGARETFTRILDDMERVITTRPGGTEPSPRAAELAGQIAGLIGKDNAQEQCERLGSEVRRIGASQDRTLSKCRMSVRWLRQQARMSVLRYPESAELAVDVQARVERFLQEE